MPHTLNQLSFIIHSYSIVYSFILTNFSHVHQWIPSTNHILISIYEIIYHLDRDKYPQYYTVSDILPRSAILQLVTHTMGGFDSPELSAVAPAVHRRSEGAKDRVERGSSSRK